MPTFDLQPKWKGKVAGEVKRYRDSGQSHACDLEVRTCARSHKKDAPRERRTLDDLMTLFPGRHQWCLTNVAKEQMAGRLRQALPSLPPPETFEEVYHALSRLFLAPESRIKGVGGVTAYDVAVRLANLLSTGMRPERYVYLHSGALDGFRELYGPKAHLKAERLPSGGYRVPLEAVAADFPDCTAFDIEDILCVRFHVLLNKSE